MDSIPSLITDLALILIVAGVVTIVFKRLRQPLVLGYIVAGFLTGPHMPYMPTVESEESIELWGQIGVIFLMFSLGLEFSFKKLLKMGFGPVISACVIMLSMMGLGCGIGYLFGWSNMNILFLGGMLSMSSTTIIYKAFNDLGLSNKRFASTVLSVLILEDIFGIVIMVLLNTLSSSHSMESSQLILSMVKLGFFLALWFLVGMWLIPFFLQKNRQYINSETLLVVSLGLCFLMVVIAGKLGYSPALGAFVMGSMLAETIEAEKIEHAVAPVKDLFGAIFFVSVGMLVSPSVLVQYWYIILSLVVAVVLGQMVFGTAGFLLSRASLRDAMQSGFSMVQIGEFSFIIATMGIKAGVIDGFLLPVIVAVSIITTFFTPYSIKLAAPAYAFLGREEVVGNISTDNTKRHRGECEVAWLQLLQQIFMQMSAYIVLCIAVLALLFVSVLLACRQLFGHWPGNAVCGVLTLMLLSLFLRPIVMKKYHSIEAKFLWKQGMIHRILLGLLMLARFVFGCVIIYHVLNYLSPYRWYWHILASIVLMLCIIWSRIIKYVSVKMERTFVQNIRMREQIKRRNENNNSPSYARQLRGRDLHIARLKLPSTSMWAGSTLAQLRIGVREQVHVVAIVRDDERINIPGGRVMLFPNDIIEVLGDDESIELFCQHMATDVQGPQMEEHDEMQLHRIIIGPNSPLVGLFIKQSGIRDDYHCMVVGFEDSEGNLTIANADRVIHRGDTMWIVGELSDVMRLKSII